MSVLNRWPRISDLNFSHEFPFLERKVMLLFSLASHFGYTIQLDSYENSNSKISWNAYIVAKNPIKEFVERLPTITIAESGFRRSKEQALDDLFNAASYTNIISRSVSTGYNKWPAETFKFPWLEYAPAYLDEFELEVVMLGALRKDIQFKLSQENKRSPYILF